ncbi:anaphase promoting complex subunit cdc16, partial [Kappamyces sp. JEL0680]
DALPFASMPDFEGAFIKSLYISRLTKYNNVDVIENAHTALQETYQLSNSPLVMLGKAELLMIQFNYKKAYDILAMLLEDQPYDMSILAPYIVCLSQLGSTNTLFTLAHQLVDLFPKHHVSWFAVGTYYFTIKKFIDARRYYSKATAIEPSFGHAWIGFAHSFALEGEHDSAISIYSSACRVLPGIHLPKLYLGMEHSRLNNWKLAEEFLQIALGSCTTDPLLHNELGVVFYEKEEYEVAIEHFKKVLELVQQAGTPLRLWGATLCNAGHAYRRLGNFKEARRYFEQALDSHEVRESSYAALGLISYQQEQLDSSIEYFHKALAINPDNRHCADMLDTLLSNLAFTSMSNPLPILDSLDFDIDAQLSQKFAKDADNLDFPDLKDEPVPDPDSFLLDSESEQTGPAHLFQSGMVTRGKLRARKSNIFEESPPSNPALAPRRGLLTFQSSPPDPFETKSPPRSNRKLFASRDLESSDLGTPIAESVPASFEDSDVFGGGPPSDEMDLDDGASDSD